MTPSEKKPQLVVLGEDWGQHPSSTQHLIRRLLPDYQVLWVNSIGLRRPRFTLHDLTRMGRKLSAVLRRSAKTEISSEQHNQPQVLPPLALPLPGNRLAGKINGHWLAAQIRAQFPELDRPLLWLSLPSAVDLVGKLGERAVIYYCGDDFSALAGVDHQAVARSEATLVEKADLILAASPALASRFPPHKTRLLTHGVDLELFMPPQPRPTDLPRGRPIAGFYGSISDWIDLPLLAETAKALPHWDLVLIGPVQTDLSPLQGLPNVHLLGPRPHHALAAYAQHWQVSLLPFVDNAQIRACNPLKLREYLAVGRPIVSTDFPALEGFRELVHISTTASSLASAINQAAFDQTNPTWFQANEWETLTRHHGPQTRQSHVAQQSWDHKAGELKTWLAELG
ncbi:glycosyltransferase [Aeromonas cavernicola]|uniref:Glycosyl transferase n=1 Tax=Aeromonas cavernicola TaxID=1006623 RepID=A0A2H9U7Y4_9GAMM|nr:glycosyltransferase [Aeromonas cavernicola]PJG60145.1 glycosyl transferase [Aeromonas cavernicola]